MLKKLLLNITNFFKSTSTSPDTTILNDSENICGYMSLTQYKVFGINSSTNRRKSFIIAANSEQSALYQAHEKGLLEPYEVHVVPLRAPSESQLEYARNRKITIPKGACLEDVSAVLTNYEEQNTEKIKSLIDYGIDKNMFFSTLYNSDYLSKKIFYDLAMEDKIAFFCFSIYRSLAKDKNYNLNTCKYKDLFYTFANENINNESFIKSMLKYLDSSLIKFGESTNSSGDIHLTGSKRTIAYQTAYKYLKERKII